MRVDVEKVQNKLRDAFDFGDVNFGMPIRLSAEAFADPKIWEELLDSLGYDLAQIEAIVFWEHQFAVLEKTATQAKAQAASTNH